MSCPICSESFTCMMRKKTSCLYCNYEFCTSCIKKYLLTNNNDPACMNCRHEWNREFIDLHLSRNFRSKDYKKHRENVLFEREKMFFPETLELLEKNHDQKKICQERIQQLSLKKKELQAELSELNNKLSSFRYNLGMLENNPIKIIQNLDFSIEKKIYVKKCITDNCNGYINNKGHCHLCKLVVCMQCYETKEEKDHVCKPENIESVQQIKKDTKSCPKCNVPIYKIDGCRQMWCTICHTAFDWKTGQVINQRIHNPHFYEWQRTNNEAIQNSNECNENELPVLSHLRIYLQNKKIDFFVKKKLYDIHRSINHIIDIEMNDLRVDAFNGFDMNIQTRIAYLKSNLSENEFKNSLVLKENKLERNKNLYLLLEMVTMTVISIFNELLIAEKDVIESEIMQKFNSLRTYANNQLERHGQRFNVKKLSLQDDFYLVRV